ncbi:TauD/TfdA family dioxygenase [Sorangium sp. So ce1128]
MRLSIQPAVTQAVSSGSLVSVTLGERGAVHVIEPRRPVEPVDWISHNKAWINSLLQETGAVLFRGFPILHGSQFERIVQSFSDGRELMIEDQNRHNQFVSDDEDVWFHNDYCDRPFWPSHLFFWCELTTAAGGQTPFVDCAKLARLLPSRLTERFQAEGWILRRRFDHGMGVDASGYFKTQAPGTIRGCLTALGAFDERWSGDRLDGFSVRFRPAFHHPTSGLLVWANNILFSNVEMIDPSIRECLIRDYGADKLPVNTYWGDGSAIEADDIAAMRCVYSQSRVCMTWQQGDVLLLDNIRTAHGRRPILGPQKVNVGMCGFNASLNTYDSLARSHHEIQS